MTSTFALTIVAPCYNEQEGLPEFVRRMCAAASSAVRPSVNWKRAAITAGNSGIATFTRSIHSGAMTKGGRSGSGK